MRKWVIGSRRFEAAVTDHSFPYGAEVRDGYSYMSTMSILPYALITRKGTISSFGRTDL